MNIAQHIEAASLAASDGLRHATYHQVDLHHALLIEMIKSLTRIVKEIIDFFLITRSTRVTQHASYANS